MANQDHRVDPPEAGSFDSLKQLVQSLDVGLAVVDPETWSVVFENAKFFQWFPSEAEGNEPLSARLPPQ